MVILKGRTQTLAIPITLQSKQPGIDYSVVSDQQWVKLELLTSLGLDNVYNKQRKNEIDDTLKRLRNKQS